MTINQDEAIIEFDIHGMKMQWGKYKLEDVEQVVAEQLEEVPSTKVYLIINQLGKLYKVQYNTRR
jgi:hypothetical protein